MANNKPNHLPKINPETRATGEPNPNNNTQAMVDRKKRKLNINKWLFLISIKKRDFSLMQEQLVNSLKSKKVKKAYKTKLRQIK